MLFKAVHEFVDGQVLDVGTGIGVLFHEGDEIGVSLLFNGVRHRSCVY